MSEWAVKPAPREQLTRWSSAEQLTLRVLGPLEIRAGGIPVDHHDLRRCRVRELVQALIVYRGARREVLADLLWPDHPDPRHNLRVTLDYLRGAIESPQRTSESPVYIRADRRTIAFDSNVHCDLWELDEHLNRAAEAEFAGDLTEALRRYDLALPLWEGPPFEEIAHLDWARDHQARWCRRFGIAATRCAEMHLAASAFHMAIYAAERASGVDPYDEQAYCITARIHLACGARQRARAALQECVSALNDLGVQPSPPTVALLAEVGPPLTVR
ncbi:MAG: AfsR/SARP family transcriptional regulator [Rhodoglobus sp.]